MIGLDALRRRRAELEHEWSRHVPARRLPPSGGGPDRLLRDEIVASWSRSLPLVDPARDSAPVEDDVSARWRESPLRRPVLELADELRTIADDAGFIAAVTDESGTILWTCGGRVMRRRAERVNFAPGGRWDETGMGTNALSLALRGRPAKVFSAEHLVAALHGWVCYSAPIRSPGGRILGVLDLSSTWDRSNPLAMSTVRTLVSAIESRLATIGLDAGRREPAGLRLTCLGEGRAWRGGVPLRLRPRQLEILTLLALEPEGFSPERLQAALFGDRPVTAATLKAQVSHLRRALGGALAQRRYQLTEPIECDARNVLAALDAGDTAAAVEAYTGPLLPESDVPGIVEWRTYLEVAVREAVLASSDPGLALRYGTAHPYDVAVHEHAHRLLPPDDGRRGIAAARIRAALS
ncbi:transcriptional regulator [Thermopolyspora flexuosa]|uniref:Transcriptional regulator n=1 Tax=Thermopolyspora flexuosa TaxID=103836 RepID=A0A543IYB4_9ACTN|nr:helix-turn-helix domain-containing protein [Thermopolyspora flexuosa]TQM75572.1 transcriptional regulator [Thermopolyspora flexuosa]GGM60441.1 transcriptional regulator [Thermopolyspora flexuosa]